jgi:DNA-binding response OmpR family regulator
MEHRILLVEDDATTREIVTCLLRSAGYGVEPVGGAGAATTCLNLSRYTLVISDWFLPDGNGITVADEAASLGAKTLIISDFLFQVPRGAERHRLVTKRLGPKAILAAVEQAIGGAVVER